MHNMFKWKNVLSLFYLDKQRYFSIPDLKRQQFSLNINFGFVQINFPSIFETKNFCILVLRQVVLKAF